MCACVHACIRTGQNSITTLFSVFKTFNWIQFANGGNDGFVMRLRLIFLKSNVRYFQTCFIYVYDNLNM